MTWQPPTLRVFFLRCVARSYATPWAAMRRRESVDKTKAEVYYREGATAAEAEQAVLQATRSW